MRKAASCPKRTRLVQQSNRSKPIERGLEHSEKNKSRSNRARAFDRKELTA